MTEKRDVSELFQRKISKSLLRWKTVSQENPGLGILDFLARASPSLPLTSSRKSHEPAGPASHIWKTRCVGWALYLM